MMQRSVVWRWFAFAFVGLLVALSFALLSFAEEAQAKGKQPPAGRESGGGAPEEATKPAGDALRGVDERAEDNKPVGDALRGGAAEPVREGKDSGGKGHGEGIAEPVGKAPKADSQRRWRTPNR